ncbi:hypothetical protein [Phyllobacterium zundukense]|nr:hypothetical protein [Phyllobacterium zundukense]
MRELTETDQKSVAGGVTEGPDGRGCTEPTSTVYLPKTSTTEK